MKVFDEFSLQLGFALPLRRLRIFFLRFVHHSPSAFVSA
jgi:hypothetical protein